MQLPKCPRCGESNYQREKRLNGNTTCLACGYVAQSSEWDKSAPEITLLRELIKQASDKSFFSTIKAQRGVIADDFLDMLEKSDFFKQFYNEAFAAGMNYSDKIKV